MTSIKPGRDGIWRRLHKRACSAGSVHTFRRLPSCAALLSGLVFVPLFADPAELIPAKVDTAAAKSRWVTAGWLSWHFRKADERNAVNLGIGLEIDANPRWTMAGGVYHNSFYDTSFYVGAIRQFWVKDSWRLGLMLGAVNGYRHLNDGGFYPYVFPMLQHQGQTLGVNLALVPPVDKTTGGLVAVQFKVRF
jgi:hypothetical protein